MVLVLIQCLMQLLMLLTPNIIENMLESCEIHVLMFLYSFLFSM